MVGSWFRVFCGVPESFKMVGHLFSHVLLRTKELFHRGLLSGHSFFRQICDGCGIALSLIVYLVNTVVNILLIGTQNCFAVLLAAWEAVSGPVQKILELTLALFSYLSSSLRTVHRLYLLVLARTQAVLLLEIWQRAVRRGSRTGQAAGSNRADAGPVDAQGPPEAVRAPLPPPPPLPPPQPQNPDPPPGTSSRDRPLKKHLCGDGDKVAPQTELLSLLKEHEERKKCVICQDSVKTVLLLPCRHLCLCRDCTDIFLRQPIHQHNCPLCRHMILQTMDVFL
ncbi:Ring finger protein 26 [Acipenser ruthenus]|uniref:E3 ubiquitin-protein ligase RNF26 n=1 Tax=Acipenser ruthenus TaxID=7906 RepID=A0A444V161_ACIRT|nr:Ring finger protein 26 [Acipenser ruthenus]